MTLPGETSHKASAGMRTTSLSRGWHNVRAELRTVRFRVLATVLAFLAAGLVVTGITTLVFDLRNLTAELCG